MDDSELIKNIVLELDGMGIETTPEEIIKMIIREVRLNDNQYFRDQ